MKCHVCDSRLLDSCNSHCALQEARNTLETSEVATDESLPQRC